MTIDDQQVSTFFQYIDVIKHLMPAKPFVVDVGSCAGWFAIAFDHYFHVATDTAFDIDSRAGEAYKSVVGDRCVFWNYGISDYNGENEFYLLADVHRLTELGTLIDRSDEKQPMAWKKMHKIPIRRLDTIFETGYIDFLKIDAEKSDYKVVLGAEKILKEKRVSVVMFETLDLTLDYCDAVDLANECGYLFNPHENSVSGLNNRLIEKSLWQKGILSLEKAQTVSSIIR